MAEPGGLAGSEVKWNGCHLDMQLPGGPIGLLGPYVFVWCYLRVADESGFAYPHVTRLLIKAYRTITGEQARRLLPGPVRRSAALRIHNDKGPV